MLTPKRLNIVAYDLGHFDAQDLSRDVLLNKLCRSRRFTTDVALVLITLRELQRAGKTIKLPRGSSSKPRQIELLWEHIRSQKAKTKTKIKKKPKEKSSVEKSTAGKGVEKKQEADPYISLDPKEWVKCSVCGSPVKRCNIEAHIARVHGETPPVPGESETINYGMIIEAIGKEWCIDFMRHTLKISGRKKISDQQVIQEFFSVSHRNLLTLLAKLDERECRVVAEYLELTLEDSDLSVFGRLLQALYKRADESARVLLQEPAIRAKPKKKAKPKKSRARAKPKGKADSEPDSRPVKTFTLEKAKNRDPQHDFVVCPICRSDVTFFHLARHLARIHPETNKFQIRVKRKGYTSSRILRDADPSSSKSGRKKPIKKPIAPTKSKSKNLRAKKKSTKMAKSKSMSVHSDQSSQDIFDRGVVVSGGAYGLGKNRKH